MPDKNAIDAHEHDFVSNAEFVLHILTEFTRCTCLQQIFEQVIPRWGTCATVLTSEWD